MTIFLPIAEISVDMVDIIGLGLAGASHKPGRELLFHLLEKVGLAQRALIINDAEAAFKVSCPTSPGFLVTVNPSSVRPGERSPFLQSRLREQRAAAPRERYGSRRGCTAMPSWCHCGPDCNSWLALRWLSSYQPSEAGLQSGSVGRVGD